MAQYDVYPGHSPDIFLLDVQSDLIEDLSTRIVIPLIPADAGPDKIKTLHPVVSLGARDFIVASHLMTAVQKSELKKASMNLSGRHDAVSAAIFMVFNGF